MTARRSGRRWRAPGRVNLIGDHTDYQDGFCVPMAVDRECRVTAQARNDARLHARSAQLDGEVDVASDGADDAGSVGPRWGRFVAGTAAALGARGVRLGGFDLDVTSSVPPGSGLS